MVGATAKSFSSDGAGELPPRTLSPGLSRVVPPVAAFFLHLYLQGFHVLGCLCWALCKHFVFDFIQDDPWRVGPILLRGQGANDLPKVT